MKIISDSVWNVIKNLIPSKQNKAGRPRLNERMVFEGICFIVESGSQWRYLPKIYGSKSAVHQTFQRWIREGVFEKIMAEARCQYLTTQNDIWLWFAGDVSFSKAPLANWSGKNPTDRGKMGIKVGVLVDHNAAPFSVCVGPANTHDSKFLEPLLKNLNLTFGNKPGIIAADSAFDVKKLRKRCKELNIALIAATNKRRKKNDHIYRPKGRWVVEQFFGYLHWWRGIKTCWTKYQESFLAIVQLAAAEKLFRLSGIYG